MEGQGRSDDNKQVVNTKRVACSGTLSASGGWDWSSLFIVQNGHRGYPAAEYAKLVYFRRGNRLFAMVSGSGKHAIEGRTN
jgi:hypothetical protein